MYYLIESSPLGESIIGTFRNLEKAEAALLKSHNNYCDYNIAKLI